MDLSKQANSQITDCSGPELIHNSENQNKLYKSKLLLGSWKSIISQKSHKYQYFDKINRNYLRQKSNFLDDDESELTNHYKKDHDNKIIN